MNVVVLTLGPEYGSVQDLELCLDLLLLLLLLFLLRFDAVTGVHPFVFRSPMVIVSGQ